MAVIKAKPTSPGRRGVVSVKRDLYKGKPWKSLVVSKSKNGGRNNNGRITVRHQGGGHKQHYRIIDFKRDKFDIPAIVERLEYDPNRSANIALLKYADGERRYIIAPSKLKVGDKVDPSTPLLTVYTNSEDDYENVRKKIADCFIIIDTEVSALPYMYEVIN